MRECKNIVIAGAGLMGTSMAQIFAQRGYQVTIYDVIAEAIGKSKNLVRINQEEQVKTGELTSEESRELQERLNYTCEKDCFTHCDLVVESIVEKIDIKHLFWKEVSALVPEDTVLASNTSGLSITEIAKAIHKPERFAGMHWFNPAHLIPLIEIIKGEESAKETVDYLYELALTVGKEPVRVNKDVPGFLANRIQLAILRESLHLVEIGAGDFEDIDRCMKYGLGFRYACLGPFEVCDMGGLDTFYHIAEYLNQDLSDAKEPQKTLKDLYEAGNFGVKAKKGFYDYNNGKDEEAIRRRDELYIKVSKLLKK
ncbi:3-hydroxyacyl-CoA dehydrogenase family protein [Aminipila sp.]|uniref:3-hydroxyacyl-CoA dehydrogenase family protein n=1 Tax=Aminipila sp. TaxID=2060095 RepID=UPI001D8C4ECC|nr:3-hydroxyacyl-CoA dehydrogenase family protein [Aminipila sp.]MBE6033401.1 3-hydroxyacyl-CoA dehydrogenase family protein [Clostridiales bacterium]